MRKHARKFTLIIAAILLFSFVANYNPATQTYAEALSEVNNANLSLDFSSIGRGTVEEDNTNYAGTNLTLSLIYPTKVSSTANGNEVDIKAEIKWINPKVVIDTTLSGSAIVYNNNDQLVLFGSFFGYNGEDKDDNFITLTITYDVHSNLCKSVLTLGVDNGIDKKSTIFEFGSESPAFATAYKFLDQFLKDSANDNQMVDLASGIDKTNNSISNETGILSLDPQLYHRSTAVHSTSYGPVLALSIYTPTEMGEGDEIKAIGKTGGNKQNAENYIINSINSTAWSTSPKYLETKLRARSNGLELMTGTQDPVSSATYFDVDIPLPYNQTYTLQITLTSTTYSRTKNSLYTGAYHNAIWNLYDMSRIDELEATNSELTSSSWNSTQKGVGTCVYFDNLYNIDYTTDFLLDTYSKISYHYLYIDGTGNVNNTYYTPASYTSDVAITCYPG